VLHLGKRWYVVSAELDDEGEADGVRLDGPYGDRRSAEEQARRLGLAE
jgi:NAD(P)H-flavin reductase